MKQKLTWGLLLFGAALLVSPCLIWPLYMTNVIDAPWLSVINEALVNAHYAPELGRFEAVRKGMPEAEVRKLVGPPDTTIRSLEELGPLSNSARPRSPVTHKALVYFTPSAAMCLVHISKDGRVEWVFVAGS